MTIQFVCHGCGGVLRTSDDRAGRIARCPTCAEPVTVPPAGTNDTFDDGFGQPMPAGSSEPPALLAARGSSAAEPATDLNAPSEFQRSDQGKTRTCPMCGERILKVAHKCPYCGEFLRPTATVDSQADHRAHIASRVQWPGIGLIIMAILAIIGGMFMALVILADPTIDTGGKIVMIALICVQFLSSVISIIGAVQLMRLRGFAMAMIGCVVSVIPFINCCFPLGLIFGIWGLACLASSEVQACFK